MENIESGKVAVNVSDIMSSANIEKTSMEINRRLIAHGIEQQIDEMDGWQDNIKKVTITVCWDGNAYPIFRTGTRLGESVIDIPETIMTPEMKSAIWHGLTRNIQDECYEMRRAPMFVQVDAQHVFPEHPTNAPQ